MSQTMMPAPPAKPYLTLSQRADVLHLFKVTRNERRVRVLTAYLGIAVGDLYDRMEIRRGTLNSYRRDPDRWAYWVREGALRIAYQMSTFLGLSLTELFEIDDEFKPWECVPLFMNENSQRLSKDRKGKSGWRNPDWRPRRAPATPAAAFEMPPGLVQQE